MRFQLKVPAKWLGYTAALLLCLPAFAKDLAVISLPPDKVTVHRDATLALGIVARSQSGQDLQFEWSKNGEVLKDQISNSLKVEKASSKDAGHYAVTVKSGEESQTFHMHVSYNPKRLTKSAPRVPAAAKAAAEKSHCGH